ncbi:MAG: chromate transporter [Candidatus Protistobacter heckmanni]|nr:chromate transporter [Candidatus Protistobacter heckmanni]
MNKRPGPKSAWELAWVFTLISLQGFGGVLPWVRRTLVEKLEWVTDRELAELLAVGQILPGPNIVNLAIILGWNMFGWRGAVLAPLGLIFAPLALLLVLINLYAAYSVVPAVRGAVAGMMPVAAALVTVTGVKLALSLPRSWRALLLGAGALICVGILRFPILPVMAALIPLGLALQWAAYRKEEHAKREAAARAALEQPYQPGDEA